MIIGTALLLHNVGLLAVAAKIALTMALVVLVLLAIAATIYGGRS